MRRRKLLIGLGGVAGAGSIVGSGAFTSVSADRTLTVAVEEDARALLRMEPSSSVHGEEFAGTNSDGLLTLDFDETEHGDGLGTDSRYSFDDVFTITNQGTQTVYVWGTFSDIAPFSDVWFYPDSKSETKMNDGDNAVVELPIGETIHVGVHIETDDAPVDGSYNLGATIHANATKPEDSDVVDDGTDSEPECVSCGFDAAGKSTSPAVNVQSTDSSSFPDVSTFMTVDTPAGNNGNLTASDFSLCENGCQQDGLDVQFTSEDKPVDFVFLLDVTGSMGDELDSMKSEINGFIADVESEGIDARYALSLFGDEEETGPPAVFPKQPLTADASTFEAAVNDTSLSEEVGYGGDIAEDGYEAILRADTEFDYRPGAQRVIIDITDAPHEEDSSQTIGGQPETKASVVDVLDEYTYFAVSSDRTGTHEPKTLAADVGGNWIQLGDNFDPILAGIEDEVSTSYRVKYTTSDTATDGNTRNVVVQIDDPDEGTLYAVTDYTAPSS